MKTLEEIKEHLSKVGYNRQAMMQIEAFLIGCKAIALNEELDFVRGKGDFEDFIAWFFAEVEWEYEKGAYIHVEDGIDALALSDVYDGKFIGTNGNNIHQYEITKETRPCLDVEIEKIDTKLYENGVMYCPYCDELEPFKGIVNHNSEEIDELEVKCHEAIENIVSILHAKEVESEEINALVESLKALAVLGKKYE